MVRTQIQLPGQQHRRLRAWAARRGISMSEAVRLCVADRLEREVGGSTRSDLVARALAVCGRYRERTGHGNVAAEHDSHLAEALGR